MNRTKRTPDDFRRNAIKYGIESWMIRDCSICGVPIGYIFFHDREVYFDGSCGCGGENLRPSSWKEVAEHYNRQTNECVIAQYDEFWHFNELQDKDSRPAEGTVQELTTK